MNIIDLTRAATKNLLARIEDWESWRESDQEDTLWEEVAATLRVVKRWSGDPKIGPELEDCRERLIEAARHKGKEIEEVSE